MSLAGTHLTREQAITGVIGACFAFLQFSTGWAYMVSIDSEPEKSETRKAPSRWGAVFQRQLPPRHGDVFDLGNAFYLYVFRALEHCAMLLQLPGAPMQSIARKSNVKKIRGRAGDLVEAVLGAPFLRRHLESGQADTQYSGWNNETAAQWGYDLNSTDADDIAASRMLTCVATVEDLQQVLKTAGESQRTPEQFCELVFLNTREFLPVLSGVFTPAAASAIRKAAPNRPAKRQRSLVGFTKQNVRSIFARHYKDVNRRKNIDRIRNRRKSEIRMKDS